MGLLDRAKNLFKPKNEVNINDPSVEIDDVLLSALINGEKITREKALMLPAVSDAVDFIAGSIASMPVKLYRVVKGEVSEVYGDTRTKLLNSDTGDTLNAYEFKKAMVEDYLLDKGGYAVVKRNRNDITGLYHVQPIYVAPYKNPNPVEKYVEFLIYTKFYKKYEVLTLLRNTKDGAWGKGVIEEVSRAIETAYTTLMYQLGLVQSGGNKKGFIQSDNKLDNETLQKLKDAWSRFYTNNKENVIVLNKGLTFKESSSSSVELQLNESKKTLNDDIDKAFHIRKDFNETFKEAIYPIIKAFEASLNSTLLLEGEKRNYFFEFDVKEIVKANLKERYEAYRMAKEIGMKTINELRQEENMNKVEGMDVIPFGLGAVLYDTENHTYFTPNTGVVSSGKETNEEDNTQDQVEGGEK